MKKQLHLFLPNIIKLIIGLCACTFISTAHAQVTSVEENFDSYVNNSFQSAFACVQCQTQRISNAYDNTTTAGTGNAMKVSISANGTASEIVTDKITDIKNSQVEFWLFNESNGPRTVQVYMSTTTNAVDQQRVLLSGVSHGIGPYTRVFIDLHAWNEAGSLSGVSDSHNRIRIVFQGNAQSTTEMHFDDFSVKPYVEPNSAPTNVSLSNQDIDENLPVNSVIGTFSTVDPDVNDTHVYTIAGSNSSLFKVSGNQLLSNTVFDYETLNLYWLNIISTDSKGESVNRNIQIGINDVLENQPATVSLSGDKTIEKNSLAGTVIGRIEITDPEDGPVTVVAVDPLGFAHPIVEAKFITGGLHLITKIDYPQNGLSSFQVKLIATDEHGATSEITYTITATSPTGLFNSVNNNSLQIFPNPVKDILTIKTANIQSVSIYNQFGDLLISSKNPQVDVSSLEAGSYFIQASNNNIIYTTKFIKE